MTVPGWLAMAVVMSTASEFPRTRRHRPRKPALTVEGRGWRHHPAASPRGKRILGTPVAPSG
ncbi:MAG: hypothetical protein R2713_08050 [Ilumatobacteraceae bacterium]